MAGETDRADTTSKGWDVRKSLGVIAFCIVIGIVVLLLQGLQAETLQKYSGQITIMLAIAGAAMMLGGLCGFLFGIPRRLQNDDPKKPPGEGELQGDEERPLYEGNTNLEQISDWLTKIIVGVTLVELATIITEIGKYGGYVADATGRRSDAAFAVGVMIFFFICGFLTGYLWTRLYLGRALTEAESRKRLQKQLSRLQQQAEADVKAIALARRQLSPGEDLVQSVDEVVKVFKDASIETLAHIFSLAENNRWRNWESNKPQMERSMTIFRALMLLDAEGRYHRNAGQLAYCLKDKTAPEWGEAEKMFTLAIERRGTGENEGWRAYEANRAIARIKLGEALLSTYGTLERLRAAILEDIDLAFEDIWVARWLKKDAIILEWVHKHQIKLEELANFDQD